MKRLVVGVSGASGQIYALRFLKSLPPDVVAHVIFSVTAAKIMKQEVGWNIERQSLKEFLKIKYDESPAGAKIIRHDVHDFFAPVSSGSFKTAGMIVIPSSAKTLAGIANGYTSTLLERAADVSLKEKRPLIIVLRESPYNKIHLENMLKAHQAGAVILPASPGFYQHPQNIEQVVDTIVARALNLLDIPRQIMRGWGEEND